VVRGVFRTILETIVSTNNPIDCLKGQDFPPFTKNQENPCASTHVACHYPCCKMNLLTFSNKRGGAPLPPSAALPLVLLARSPGGCRPNLWSTKSVRILRLLRGRQANRRAHGFPYAYGWIDMFGPTPLLPRHGCQPVFPTVWGLYRADAIPANNLLYPTAGFQFTGAEQSRVSK